MSSFTLRLEHQQKRFLKIHSESAYFSFFLTRVELKQYIRSYIPVVRLKSISDSRPKRAKSISVFRPKRRKTLPFGAAHTLMAYVREYPSPVVRSRPNSGEEGEPLPRGEEQAKLEQAKETHCWQDDVFPARGCHIWAI